MGYVWKYTGSCQKPDALPAGVLEEWEATLKGERARILSSLLGKVPNESAFQNRIADASSDRYEEFLKTVGDPWNVTLIELKQRVKLAAKYVDWDTGVDNAFAVGGTFETNVTNKKDKYKLARFVLGAVGHRATVSAPYGVWNPVTVAVLLARGDKRPFRYFDGNDAILPNQAAHEVMLDATLGPLISPSIIAKAVQGVMLCKYAGDAAWAEATIDNTIVTPTNNAIKTLVDACLISPYTGYVQLDWIHADKAVNIIAQLTAKT